VACNTPQAVSAALGPVAVYSAHSLSLVAAALLAPASLAACSTPRAASALVALAVYSVLSEPHTRAACRPESAVVVAYILALLVAALALVAYTLPWALAERAAQVAARTAEPRLS